MGCISSKSSTHQQPNDPVIIPNHHFISPSNTNHAIHDAFDQLVPPKHAFTIHTNLKSDDALERCSSFHTVEEYDELLQRISKQNDAELAGVPVPETTEYSSCENDSSIETRDEKKQDMEFQTVASLRQWLHAPGGGGCLGDADAADYTTPKVGFSFYGNDHSNNTQGAEENSVLVKSGREEEEEESIVELVAAFDKYMQQLQIDEDNILKQIHNMID